MRRIATALAVPLMLCASVEARPVKWWSPKELYEKADAVVLASPVSIQKTEEIGEIQLADNPALPTVTYRATLSVKYVIKGDDLEELEFRYSPLDHAKLRDGPMINGPGRISLTKDAVYVFYLNKDKKNGKTCFVGVLEGEFDDDQGVVLIAPESATQNATARADKPGD
jgi:hypothetical protein